MSQWSSLTGAGGFTGLTPDAFPTNSRAVLDANYITSKALPASATTAYTTAMDLGDAVSGLPYATTETVNLVLLAPALASPKLADSGTVTYTIEDSANNSAFATLAGLDTVVQLGAANAGAAAVTKTWKLPPATRRYVRVNITSATSPGDLSTATAYLQLAF